jgi:hypothetical protein
VLLRAVPLAFMAKVPVAVVFNKPAPFLGVWAWLARLLVGPASLQPGERMLKNLDPDLVGWLMDRN